MITLLLLIFPILAGLLLLLTNVGKSKNVSFLAAIFGLAEFAFSIWGLNTYLKNPKSSLLDFNKSWVNDFSINFHLGWDGVSALMVLLCTSLVALIALSIKTVKYENKNRLYALLFLAQAALIGVFTAKDIFVFYFFFEIALIPVYLISNIWGGENSSKITFKMLVYTVFGSLFMLVAFVLLYMRAQTSDIDSLKTTITLLPENIQNFLFWAFLLAFCIKMPVFPFHTWLPDTYSESPTPATMLLSGLLSKMGVYGLIRILLPFAPLGVSKYAFVIIMLAVFGLIYGSIIAIQQDSIKRLIAYSSFAHMGIMAGAVFTQSQIGIQGAIFQMVAHGFNVVGLFFIAKIIFERTGSRSLSALGGITQKAPMLSVAFMIILLGSVALPLTNGFVGEFLMLKSLFDYNAIIGSLAGLSVIFGAVYMLRFFQKTMFGPLNPKNSEIKDLSQAELWVLIPIISIILITGLFPNIILDISKPFVESLSLAIK